LLGVWFIKKHFFILPDFIAIQAHRITEGHSNTTDLSVLEYTKFELKQISGESITCIRKSSPHYQAFSLQYELKLL
jgi:hypothetical protein